MPHETPHGNEGLNTPRDFVQSGWDYFRELGGEWITMSQQALLDMAFLNVTPYEFNTELDLNIDYATFLRPVAPTAPEFGDVSVTVPTAPTVDDIVTPEIGDMPAEPDFTGLVYSPPAPPTTAIPTMPSDVTVTLTDIVIPDAPVFVLPEEPDLYVLEIPVAPTINLPIFVSERPVFNTALPDSSFNWQEVAYSSALLDDVKEHLTDMMNGGLGLPPGIEQAIFDRGRGRADMLSMKRLQEAAEELGSRGLYEPAPFIYARLDRARDEGRKEAAGQNKDVTIRAAEIEVESIRFAIQQSAALEIALLQVNSQINQRALEAAKITSDIQLSVFNAQVQVHNLSVEMFKADAQVFRDLIQAEIARIEIYKAQIEGQKAIGEVNEQLVRAYSERIRSTTALVEIYRAQIEGAKAKGEINTQRIDQARLRVQAFGEEVRAWGAVQEGYKAQVESALGNIRVYEAIGGVYGRRVDAYRAKGDAVTQQGQFQIAKQKLELDGYTASLEGVRTQVAAQTASIDARARVFGARAGMYEAEGRVVSAESDALGRTNAQRIEAARARAEISQRNIDQHINQNIQIATIYVEQLKAKAQVISQLAASTMSGVNFNASYSGSLSYGYSKSASISWNGETADNTNLPQPGFIF